MTNTSRSTKSTSPKSTATKSTSPETTSEKFSDDEIAAMKEHAKELKASARRGSRADKAAAEEADVVAKIAEMQESDRVMAERVHAIVKENAPGLAPKLWYGMPSYARDGKVVCFFQSAEKFKARYATLGFSDQAHLDEGSMWPTSYALTRLTAADEAMIATLVKNAAH
ncbi:DUF1801 domain-containing protein [Streptomyces sp. TBY4]|nr:DUF1801 domain-containing protein [Streptomyces sp. TBY4]MCP3754016.1 DUF1801 domain-containing protein [Streptomyces sp. TBY4]